MTAHVKRARPVRSCPPLGSIEPEPSLYHCHCPAGPIEPDSLGVCSCCGRTRRVIVRCERCGLPDVREVMDLDGTVTLRCLDCADVQS